MTVQLDYTNHLLQFFKNISCYADICLMLSVTYYAQNYAGIIGWSLLRRVKQVTLCQLVLPQLFFNLNLSFQGGP